MKEKAGPPEQFLLVAETDVPRRVPHRPGSAGRIVRRRGKRLAHYHLAPVVDHDAVGEGAADVDTDQVATSRVRHNHLIFQLTRGGGNSRFHPLTC